MSDSQNISIKVISQIALMQSVVAQLPDLVSILHFVCNGLKDIPGLSGVDYELIDDNNRLPHANVQYNSLQNSFPIRYKHTDYAILHFQVEDQEVFQNYIPYIKNFCTVLSVAFEEKRQRKLKDDLLQNLEELVSERTKELEQEISERKKIEATLRRSEFLLLESQRVAILGSFITDLNNGTWHSSGTLDNIFGINNDFTKSIAGWLEIVHPDDRVKMEQYLNDYVISQGNKFNKEYRIVRLSDNAERWVLTKAEIEFDESGIAIKLMGITQDITRQKKHELELKRTNEELQNSLERINTINRKLKDAKKQAEESDRLKSAFLANMSHEIRTPMNGILGFVDLLKNPNLSGGDQNKYIQIIEKSGARMLNIINDLIDISKIEEGQIVLHFQKASVNTIVNDLFIFFEPEAKRKGIKLTQIKGCKENESVISVDSDRLNQVLTNLIKNAIKFTSSGEITFGYIMVDANLEFFVKDSGMGIPNEMKEKIFDRFRQVDNSISSGAEGAGLGLAISKALVELHGGKMWVKSEVSHGSTFFFTLPIRRDEERKPESNNIPELSEDISIPRGAKILVAEDDDVCYMYLEEVLNRDNLKLIRAKNGAEAIEKVESIPDIALILMDIKLPVLDGYQATKFIKNEHPGIPIIAQTAFALTSDKQMALQAGCNDFISKPIIKEDLLELISKYINLVAV